MPDGMSSRTILQPAGKGRVSKHRSQAAADAAFSDSEKVIAALSIAAVTYNAVLAAINAHGVHLSMSIVAACELLILTGSLVVILATGVRRGDVLPAAMIYFIILISVFLSLVWERPFPDPARNFAIIALFTMLGVRSSDRLIRRVFMIATCVVGLFLLLEVTSLTTYVDIFQPAAYLENTRGISQFSLNSTGLFANALGFRGRFSFGVFDGPRTSSIFLEQVSLSGYSSVMTVFLLAKWESLGRLERIAHVLLIVGILVTNNARTASALALVSIPAYFIYPYLMKYLNFLIGPGILLAAWAVVTYTHAPLDAAGGDDLAGRLALTIANLSDMQASELLIGDLPRLQHLYDSGYAYLICSTTVVGLIAFWYYDSALVPQLNSAAKRAAWGASVYTCTWLCIGGTAIFTMKTSALLWLLMGHMRAQSMPRSGAGSSFDDTSDGSSRMPHFAIAG